MTPLEVTSACSAVILSWRGLTVLTTWFGPVLVEKLLRLGAETPQAPAIDDAVLDAGPRRASMPSEGVKTRLRHPPLVT